MFNEYHQGVVHMEQIEPNWRAFATVIDKENVNPAGLGALSVPWTDMLADDNIISATDAGSEYPNSSCKTPGSRNKVPSKLSRRPLRNITPLFERKVIERAAMMPTWPID